ncbi:MAG: glycerol-3-phosphate 1-O-acyltransferase PlsY [Thermodesulfobacteriota bacterium]
MNYLAIFLAYLVGSIPFGLLLGKMAGIDVRDSGSRNIGATNVTRLAGKKFGVFTLLFDAAKGLLPMVVAQAAGAASSTVLLCGAAAFFGHCYPVYLRFRGGKGVATALGVFLFLDLIAVAGGIAIFVLAVALSGYVSLGSLLAAASVSCLVWLRHGLGNYFYLALFVTALIWLKHHENIGRLIKGAEKSFKKKKTAE